MASPVSTFAPPPTRPPMPASWRGTEFSVQCGCRSISSLACAHVFDFYDVLGDVEYCRNSGLQLLVPEKTIMLPFAQDHWVDMKVQRHPGSTTLYRVVEMTRMMGPHGENVTGTGLEMLMEEGEGLVRFIRAVRDTYVATVKYEAVMASLLNKRALPCFVSGHRSPGSDLLFMRELKRFVPEYFASLGVDEDQVASALRNWSGHDLFPAFHEIALKQARSLVHTDMCTICWDNNVRPGNVDPDLIPDL